MATHRTAYAMVHRRPTANIRQITTISAEIACRRLAFYKASHMTVNRDQIYHLERSGNSFSNEIKLVGLRAELSPASVTRLSQRWRYHDGIVRL